MSNNTYFGLFTQKQDICSEFGVDQALLQDLDILFAAYTYEDYSGQALVVAVDKQGALFEVNGSHCSCYGLEGQWELEPTDIPALMQRSGDFYEELVKPNFQQILAAHSQKDIFKTLAQLHLQNKSASKAKM